MLEIKCDRCKDIIDSKSSHYAINVANPNPENKNWNLDLCEFCYNKIERDFANLLTKKEAF